METCNNSNNGQLEQDQLTFWSEAPLANHLASPDFDKALQMLAETSQSRFLQWLKSISPIGWFGKMCPAYCPIEQMRSETLSQAYPNSGITAPGGCWMLNISECHKDAAACSLSQVLENNAPEKYFLSQKACAGILRRAARRKKKLPKELQIALEVVVNKAGGPELI